MSLNSHPRVDAQKDLTVFALWCIDVPNTHSVDKTLQKPFGGVNTRCHLLLVLWRTS